MSEKVYKQYVLVAARSNELTDSAVYVFKTKEAMLKLINDFQENSIYYQWVPITKFEDE